MTRCKTETLERRGRAALPASSFSSSSSSSRITRPGTMLRRPTTSSHGSQCFRLAQHAATRRSIAALAARQPDLRRPRGSRPQPRQQAHVALNDMERDARRFAEADKSGDQLLDLAAQRCRSGDNAETSL